MKVFCHINEHRELGWENLRAMVLAYDSPVIWAPSFAYLLHARRTNPRLPDPQEVMTYIEMKRLRVMGRTWWFRKTEKRANHDWKFAREWTEYDQKLETWRRQDELQAQPSSARVRALADEKGEQWAKRQLKSRRVSARSIAANIAKVELPKGALEKIRGKTTPSAQATLLLKDIKNHSDAFRRSGADRYFGTYSEWLLLKNSAALLELEGGEAPPAVEPLGVSSVAQGLNLLIERLVKAGRPGSAPDPVIRMQQLLENAQYLQEFRGFVTDADELTRSLDPDVAERTMAHELVKRIDDKRIRLGFLAYLKSGPKADALSDVIDAGMAAGAASIGEWIGGGLHLASLLLHHVRRPLRWLGWLEHDYSGPRWPLLLAFGKRSAKRRRLMLLLDELTKPRR
jgi:hypothetical protein